MDKAKLKSIPKHIQNYSKKFSTDTDRDFIKRLFIALNKPFLHSKFNGHIWFDGTSDDSYGQIQPACPEDFWNPEIAEAYVTKPFNAWCNFMTGYLLGHEDEYEWSTGSAPKTDVNDYSTWSLKSPEAYCEDVAKKMKAKAEEMEKILNKTLKESVEFSSFKVEVVNKRFDIVPSQAYSICPIFLKISKTE